MVATLLRLKITLVSNSLRREVWRLIMLVLGGVWAVGMLPSVVAGALWLAAQGVDVRHDALAIAGALIVLGWAVVPLLILGADDSLEPVRFATFGIPARRLAPGLLVASTLTIPSAFIAVVCILTVTVWFSEGAVVTMLAVVGAALAFVTCIVVARVTTAAAAFVLGRRRAREISVVAVVAVVAVAVPVAVSIGTLGLDGALERVPALADWLSWTPLGAAWLAPAVAAQGDLVGGVGRLLLAAGFVGAGVLVWTSQVERLLTRPAAQSGHQRRQRDALAVARAGKGIHGGARSADWRAVARRSLRYWSTDPRYLQGIASAVILPLLIIVLLGATRTAPVAAAALVGPLVASTMGWARHNDTAFDGTAFWMHLTAGVRGSADRWGRVAGMLAWALPFVIVATLAGVLVSDTWRLLPAVLGLALGLLLTGLGVSMVTSASFQYPVPASGASPFATAPGTLGASLVAQLVSSAATGVVASPVVAVFVLAVKVDARFGWLTLGVGLLGGSSALVAGTSWGGRILDARGAQLLARMG